MEGMVEQTTTICKYEYQFDSRVRVVSEVQTAQYRAELIKLSTQDMIEESQDYGFCSLKFLLCSLVFAALFFTWKLY